MFCHNREQSRASLGCLRWSDRYRDRVIGLSLQLRMAVSASGLTESAVRAFWWFPREIECGPRSDPFLSALRPPAGAAPTACVPAEAYWDRAISVGNPSPACAAGCVALRQPPADLSDSPAHIVVGLPEER